ncbi:MAG: hypothetical protein GFH27_549297n63 [Chloroflexi bacterium AL-W]|nr:hypothetical protein [Chloroflexi bacterium AL-N1]NOK68587.1 hypothetical protein [Chloroflexi bacterium AL-N10]NOK76073.1 hypothetical protein [Chloroflexi bacterium AL-N5]NOK82546.1 hypothetical protein [Chloroflexi bacterium AL-W]NOK92856.1 hypothetical protein [Chloroflexi bacterium AL-N15]
MTEGKLVFTWNFPDGKERECLEFLIGQFCPELLRLGVQTDDAWYTQLGNGPQMTLVTRMDNTDAAQAFVSSSDFQELYGQLFDYAEDLNYRIAEAGPSSSGLLM